MQPASKQILSVILQTDSSLTYLERQLAKHLLDGTPLPAANNSQRLISASEVCEILGIGKTRFYEIRDQYPELAKTDEFGPTGYRLDWVLALVNRVGEEALTKLLQEGGAACR